MSVINCKKCNKVFKKQLSDYCPICIGERSELFTRLYRTIQHSEKDGGIAITELAQQEQTTVEEIETFYLDGKFGTAAMFLKIHCQNCKAVVGIHERTARYCIHCGGETAQKAGVQIRSLQEIREEEQQVKRQQDAAKLLSTAKPPPPANGLRKSGGQNTATPRYGMRRSEGG